MHIHILGIAGVFMAGVARLAKQLGHRLSGSDDKPYPPMSEQLDALGVEFYPKDRLPDASVGIEHCLVGNVMARGMPVVEELLESGIAYSSGPEWLYRNVLRGRRVIAVAGTHGKSTTAGMLAWILRDNGIDAGYLIGAVPENFGVSADLGSADCFVIEADEYDSAFFDKRPKFLHYQPKVLVINNIELDHVDIYPGIEEMRRAYHFLLRQLPASCEIIARAGDANIDEVLRAGLYSRLTRLGSDEAWSWRDEGEGAAVLKGGEVVGSLRLASDAAYNRFNALAAVAAAEKCGVSSAAALASLASFRGTRRRLQCLFEAGPTRLYEDFAHHPTAIAAVIAEFNKRLERAGRGRLILLIELGSHSMRSGHHSAGLLAALAKSGLSYVYCPDRALYNALSAMAQSEAQEGKAVFGADALDLLDKACRSLRAFDQAVILSNRDFGGAMPRIRQDLQQAIERLEQTPQP